MLNDAISLFQLIAVVFLFAGFLAVHQWVEDDKFAQNRRLAPTRRQAVPPVRRRM